MALALCVICVGGLGLALARTFSQPGEPGTPGRALELQRHPERVRHADVRARLLADGVAAPTVDRVLGLARARRFSARTLARWLDAHGAERLVVVVDAGLAEDAMIGHLEAGTEPRWSALEVFARLGEDGIAVGMPLAELLDPASVPRLEELTYPPELADWSTDDAASAREPLPLTEWETDGDGGWPSVA